MDGGGIIYEGEDVQKAFVTHYENFLGVKGDISLTPTPDLFQNRLETGVTNNMVRPISDEEGVDLLLAILNIMPFVEGSLPVKYLGVPLIASRLIFKDCKVLVEKMEGRITNWKNKMLSFAGRMQLIVSVLSALYIYWASVFILHKRVIAELEV
ncbi:hypothetical protein QVD17_41614 [Tagetes erecta]|uniref:Uncharacterized protein n=1 Tax=Tagetes erecta TaxID=13708 RepID=A0AAD8N902_TARER|nr:hypothetical protein QVD17_41614 [Tagetes erecta]